MDVGKLFENFHRKLYSYYTTGGNIIIIIILEDLNNEFMKYNDANLILKPSDSELLVHKYGDKYIIKKVDDYNYLPYIISNDGLNLQSLLFGSYNIAVSNDF